MDLLLTWSHTSRYWFPLCRIIRRRFHYVLPKLIAKYRRRNDIFSFYCTVCGKKDDERTSLFFFSFLTFLTMWWWVVTGYMPMVGCDRHIDAISAAVRCNQAVIIISFCGEIWNGNRWSMYNLRLPSPDYFNGRLCCVRTPTWFQIINFLSLHSAVLFWYLLALTLIHQWSVSYSLATLSFMMYSSLSCVLLLFCLLPFLGLDWKKSLQGKQLCIQ